MRQRTSAFLAIGLVLTVPVLARADDNADARALVNKAIKAHGGDKLAKFSASTVKLKGTVHAMGQAIPFTGEVNTHGADRQKVEIEASVGAEKFRVINILNGDKGWSRMGEDTKELDKDTLANAKSQAYGAWVATLVPLKDKAFTLATVGEFKLEKRTALGIKVSRKGHKEVDLYFDKETGLLVKSESRVRDEGSGQEVTEETFYDGYKEVQGTKQAMKFTIKRDGKLFLEAEATEVELAEKLDASVFAKP